MRALVVYESMFGNTHLIADNIADGLCSDFEVTLAPAAEATWDLVADADLLVAGAPTHMHGLSSRSTRRMAVQAAAKDDSGLQMDADADRPGMRDWLRDLGHRDVLAAAFDTRLNGVPAFTGAALEAPPVLLARGASGQPSQPGSQAAGHQAHGRDGGGYRAAEHDLAPAGSPPGAGLLGRPVRDGRVQRQDRAGTGQQQRRPGEREHDVGPGVVRSRVKADRQE